MSIRTKIGIILLCAVFGIGIAEYCVQRCIVLPGFLELEREEAIKGGSRLVRTIENEIDHLNRVCTDWAHWDDTYAFVNDRSERYIRSNLLPGTFADNRINLISIYDLTGRPVHAQFYDLVNQSPASFAAFPEEGLPSGHPLAPRIPLKPEDFPVTGFLFTDKGPLMISANLILQSNSNGPPRGLFIMGRLMDDQLSRNLFGASGIEIKSISADETSHLLHEISSGNAPAVQVETISRSLLKIHAIFPDLAGKQPLCFTATIPRNISLKGYKTVQYEMYSILIAGLAILVLALIGLEKTVLTPLAAFTTHTRRIEETMDYSKRLSYIRKDEIGVMARAFDKMVSRMQMTLDRLKSINDYLQEDIEKRKQAENALKESEERFRLMVEQAPDAVFVHDMEGRFRMVNQVACDRLGYERSELLNLSVDDVDPDYRYRDDPNTYWYHLSQGAPTIFESRHRRKDEFRFPVEVSLSPILDRGEKLVLAMVRDVSERKQMEERIRYTRKMEALSTMTAGIAHNFNNILSVIIGNTDLARYQAPAESKAAASLKNIEKACLRAKEIVWQLISFSQQSISDVKVISLPSIAAEIITELQDALPQNILVKKSIRADCRPIFGSADQIRQLIINLWQNAVEAIGEKEGTIEIGMENITIDENQAPAAARNLEAGDYIRIIFADTGRGIEPQHLDRIFDPYFTTKNFADGAGMGLSIVYGIVKSNRGSIHVDSTPGKGTRFTIDLPVK